jgi:hypothetical protein
MLYEYNKVFAMNKLEENNTSSHNKTVKRHNNLLEYILKYPGIHTAEVDKNGDGIVVLVMKDGSVVDFTVPHAV